MVEALIAAGLFVVMWLVLWQLWSRTMGQGAGSATRLTGASFLRQDVRLALEKLLDRLEQGIEILEPAPGRTGAELVFKDILNHTVRLAIDDRQRLVSRRERSEERIDESRNGASRLTAAGRPFAPTNPVDVPRCRRVAFRVLSPSQVAMEVTVADQELEVTVLASARLRNAGLVEDD
jgi:hypothetical protein